MLRFLFFVLAFGALVVGAVCLAYQGLRAGSRDPTTPTGQDRAEASQSVAKPPAQLRMLLQERDFDIIEAKMQLANVAHGLLNAIQHFQDESERFEQQTELWWALKRDASGDQGVPPGPRPIDAYGHKNRQREAAAEFEIAMGVFLAKRRIILDTFDLKVIAVLTSESAPAESSPLPTAEEDLLIYEACRCLVGDLSPQIEEIESVYRSAHDPNWQPPLEAMPLGFATSQ